MSNISKLKSKEAWESIAERGISTGIQVAIPMVAAAVTLTAINWLLVLNIVGAAVLLSVLKNVLGVLTTGTPSIGDVEVPASAVVAQETNSGLVVAGKAYVEDGQGEDIPVGTPVVIEPVEDDSSEAEPVDDEGDTLPLEEEEGI